MNKGSFQIKDIMFDYVFWKSINEYSTQTSGNWQLQFYWKTLNLDFEKVWMENILGRETGKFNIVNSSVIRQKGESQNGCYKKTSTSSFPKKQTFLNPW